jgi:hypothetical protein
MTVKIHDTICPVRQDKLTKRLYVDFEGQATSATTTDELLDKLRGIYGSVSVYSEAPE